jgi:hypothetical protein
VGDTAKALMRQVAPYPQALADLVGKLSYREHLGWKVWLDDDLQRDKPGRHSGESRGMTLIVQRVGPNTYHPDQVMAVNHYFPVPPATFTENSWRRWLFDRLGDVDDHERMEDFTLVEHGDWINVHGEHVTERVTRPYAPVHKPGVNPYVVHELTSPEDIDTDFRGRRVHGEQPA